MSCTTAEVGVNDIVAEPRHGYCVLRCWCGKQKSCGKVGSGPIKEFMLYTTHMHKVKLPSGQRSMSDAFDLLASSLPMPHQLGWNGSIKKH